MTRKAKPDDRRADLRRRHLRFGWWALLVFLTIGLVLEGFHGFKVSFYMDAGSAPRRLMLTLAHAHGTLLALVNIAFAATIAPAGPATRPSQAVASAALLVATLLLPGGFFLGGLVIYGGDPGLGILLVPVGGVALIAAVALAARLAGRSAD